MVDVKEKWALITGATRGIGYEAALFMAKQGSNLVLHGRTKENIKKVVDEVKALGSEAYGVAAELSDLVAVNGMLDEIKSRKTPIDFVFNNAGIQVAYRTDYLNTPTEDFTTSFLVNTIAPAVICYRFLPLMLKKGFGRILNTTSGIRNEPQQAGYSSSKAALDKFTLDLASTLKGTGVILSLTDPGWCTTDLGGPRAPNTPQSAIPGVCVGAFVDDGISGRKFDAQDFAGLSLEDAVKKAQRMISEE